MKKQILLVMLVLSVFVCNVCICQQEVTKSRTVKEYFKLHTDLRIADDAVETYKTSLNNMSTEVIKRASALAKQDNRKTILNRDIQQATDEVFRRKPISVSELMEKIQQLSIIDLASLSTQVKTYANQLLEKKES